MTAFASCDLNIMARLSAGYAGAFCSPCPVGEWSDGQSCQACGNKQGSSFYAADAWPNSSCFYKCDWGLPDVMINPNCLNNIDFAMSCFGGRWGFLAVLFCPVSLFLLGRSLLQPPTIFAGKSVHFQPEQLPSHLCRFHFTGDNSAQRPWQVPSSSALSSVPLDRKSLDDLVDELRAATRIPAWEPIGRSLSVVAFLGP